MYIDPLALQRLEEGGLPSHLSQDAQNRIHTQSGLTTAPASIKHHWPQHLHLLNIIGHSTAVCPTSSTTALSSIEHHQLQHCHQHIAIITNPSELRYLTPSELRNLITSTYLHITPNTGVQKLEYLMSARHLNSQGTCELHLSRDSSSRASSSRLCI
jgi:hypothetical protein